MLSVQQLRTTLTRTQGLNYVLGLMQSLGFQTTGWANGKIQKTLVTTIGTIVADFSEVVKFLTEFGFNDYASGDAMDEFSWSRFRNRKIKAVATEGPVTLTSIASIPYTIQVGQLIATTSDGIQFRNTTGGTIPSGSASSPGTLEIQWKAMLAGERGNVDTGNLNRLVTALAGVTISNPGNPWYSTTGKDEQSDASIALQNSTKWARLTVELVRESYINIGIAAGAVKVDVDDNNPRGAGTIDVYAAAGRTLLSNDDLTAMQALIAARAFQTDSSWPPASDSRVALKHPPTNPLSITAVIYRDPGVINAEMLSRVTTALEDFLVRTPLGGWTYGAEAENAILVEDISNVIKGVEGVRSVLVSVPATTVAIGTLNLVTKGTWNLSTVAAAA